MISAQDGPFLAFVGCLALMLVNLVSLSLAGLRLRRAMPRSTFPEDAPVSLIRPICGLERFSEETLESGFRLAYRDYELIFCVADAGDPVLPLVRRLIAKHPHVAARSSSGKSGSATIPSSTTASAVGTGRRMTGSCWPIPMS